MPFGKIRQAQVCEIRYKYIIGHILGATACYEKFWRKPRVSCYTDIVETVHPSAELFHIISIFQRGGVPKTMYHIIMNPTSKSGKGLFIWKKLEAILIKKNIPYALYQSNYNGHVTELTRQITAANRPVNLLILGGDGTVNEALQGIEDFGKISIGYIPTGSSNDLARALKLCRDPEELLLQILDGTHTHMVDLGILTYESSSDVTSRLHSHPMHKSRYFIVSSGIGFDAAVCEEALSSPIKDTLNRLKLGKLTYLCIALKQLFAAKSISCELTLDSTKTIYVPKLLFTALMIHPYEGGGFCFCPQANDSDGLLDLCVVGNLPRLLILLALPTAFFGRHYIFPKIDHYTASSVQLKTSAPLWVHTDGEVHLKATRISVSCLKQRIRFLV